MRHYFIEVFTHLVMLWVTTEIGRQNSQCMCKNYKVNVHNVHPLVVCFVQVESGARPQCPNRFSSSLWHSEASMVLTVSISVTVAVTWTPVWPLVSMVTAPAEQITMALLATVIYAAQDVVTRVMLSLVHVTVRLGGMKANVTLGKSVS